MKPESVVQSAETLKEIQSSGQFTALFVSNTFAFGLWNLTFI